MLLSHLFESDELPLLAQLIMRRIQAGETVGIDASMQQGNSPIFGKITGITYSGDGLLSLSWQNFTRPGGGFKVISRGDFDNKFDLVKDEDGDWLLVNAKVSESQGGQDIELMLDLIQMLFDKGQLHVYWRETKRMKGLEYLGKVINLEREVLQGEDHLALSVRGGAAFRVGYTLDQLKKHGELTKIDGRHALLMTGNFSS